MTKAIETVIILSTDYTHPDESFFQKSQTLGLGQTNQAEIFWAKSETFVYFTKITPVTCSINKIIFVCSKPFLTSIYIICSSFKILTPLSISAFTTYNFVPISMLWKLELWIDTSKKYFTLLCHCKNVPLSKSLCSRTKSSYRKNLCIEPFQKTKKDLAKKSKKNQGKFPFSILSAF